MRKLLVLSITTILLLSCVFSNSLALEHIEIDVSNSSDEFVKISINNQDTKLELSYENAQQIKDKLLDIEKNFNGKEKILEQINIFKELGIFSSDFTIDSLLSAVKNSYYFINPNRSSIFGFAVGGPFIVSHLTIGARIRPLLLLGPRNTNQSYVPIEGFLNKSRLNVTYGVLSSYVGFALNPVFVTVFGPKIIKTLKNPIFIFFEILVPCIGFSIAFEFVRSNNHPLTLFEYNLDACLFGFISGF